jgi:hypothetical protein
MIRVRILQCKTTSKNVFCKLFSSFIMKFQKTNYSHYAIEVDGMIADATRFGVRNRNAVSFFIEEEIISEFNFSIEIEKQNYDEWLKQYLGRPYGFAQLIGLFSRNVGLDKHVDFGFGDKTIICCEFVVMMLRDLCKLNLKTPDQYDLVQTEKILKSL